jgi:hypothetical protein
MFNAIKYTEELKKAGFSPDQADISMKVLIDVMNENFATKSDIQEMRQELKSDIHALNLKIDSAVERLDQKIDSTAQRLDSKIDSKIDSLAQKMESGFREMEYKMTLKLGTISTIAIGVTATVLKLIQSGH